MKVRTNKIFIDPSESLPEYISEAIHYLKRFAVSCYKIEIPDLPKSLNHQYGRGAPRMIYQNGKPKFVSGGSFLKKEITGFREIVKYACIRAGKPPRITGTIAAVILFQSQKWITKKNDVAKQDMDNKIKPLLDAIQEATGIQDELIFNIHSYKIHSRSEKTTVYLFDLGDVVESYY